ncbi:MAG: Ig-like domain repeat protein [Terracidiphilus sp.]
MSCFTDTIVPQKQDHKNRPVAVARLQRFHSCFIPKQQPSGFFLSEAPSDSSSLPGKKNPTCITARNGYKYRGAALRGLCRLWLVSAGCLAALLLAADARAQSTFGSPSNPVAVGSATGNQSVTVTAVPGVSGTVSKAEVLTFGASGLDFVEGTGTSSCDTITFSSSTTTCTESVTFTPAAPGLRMGAVVLLDASGNLLGEQLISGTGSGGLGVFAPGDLITVAGQQDVSGSAVDDGGPATKATLELPASVVMDGAGNLYIADSFHNRIRMVCDAAHTPTPQPTITGTSCTAAAIGYISTAAGNGTPGDTGNGGAAANSELYIPSGLAIDGAGNLYIADSVNGEIREIDAATGIISVVAGGAATVCGGATDPMGDGCLATAAILNSPQGVTADASGDLFIADSSNNRIREVNASTGLITTVAGGGSGCGNKSVVGDGCPAASAELKTPYAVAFDAQGNMYIPDSGDNEVREVLAGSNGVITSSSDIEDFAGNGISGNAGNDGPAFKSELDTPSGVAVDPAGDVFIADTRNNRIMEVSSAASASPGIASPFLGNSKGQSYANSKFSTVSVNGLLGLYFDSTGDLYFSGYFDMVVREIQSNLVALDFTGSVPEGSQSTSTSGYSSVQTIANQGNLPLDLTAITAQTNAALDPATTTCTPGSLAIASTCTIGAEFAPTVAGNLVTNIDVTGAMDDSPLDIVLVGTVAAVNSTKTTAVSSPNPSYYGNAVTFTATVTPGGTAPTPTGSVNFVYNGLVLGSGTLSGNPAQASFATSSLTVGTDPIAAVYVGDANNTASTSPILNQVVNPTTTSTAVTASPTPGIAGAPETITATVSAIQGASTTPGTVTFTSGTTVLGSAAVGTGGTAAIVPTLALGSYQIVASYAPAAGDTNDGGSVSGPLAYTVAQATTQIVVTSSQTPAVVMSPVTFTAKVTGNGSLATGAVTFFASGTSIGTANLDATGTATVVYSGLAVGAYSITANYAGDTNDSPGASAAFTQVIATLPTLTTLGSASTGGSDPQEFLAASVQDDGVTGPTPTGTVTFASGTSTLGQVALNASGVASLTLNLSSGSYSIVANYSGDALHSPSSSQVVSATTVAAAGFNLAVAPPAVSLADSQNATVTVTLTSQGGFSDTIGLGCLSLPAGVTCQFSKTNVSLAANGAPTAQLTIDTNSPLTGGSSAMNAQLGGRRVEMAGFFLPFGLFFGWLFWRQRRRSRAFLTLVLLFALSGVAFSLSGCSNFSAGAATPGTYTIQVVGAGSSSNIVHYQNVTLTITK